MYVISYPDDDSSGSSGSGVDSSCDLCLELCSGVGDFYMTNTEGRAQKTQDLTHCWPNVGQTS